MISDDLNKIRVLREVFGSIENISKFFISMIIILLPVLLG